MDVSNGPTDSGAVNQLIAGPGKYTVGGNGLPASSGAVNVAEARTGYYTIDTSNEPTSSGAVNEALAPSGKYTVDEIGEATSSGAVNVEQAPQGFYTLDSSNQATSSGAVQITRASEGYYINSANTAVSVGAVNQAIVSAGYHACIGGDTDGIGVNIGADNKCVCPVVGIRLIQELHSVLPPVGVILQSMLPARQQVEQPDNRQRGLGTTSLMKATLQLLLWV